MEEHVVDRVIDVDEKAAKRHRGSKRERSGQQRRGCARDYGGCRVPTGTHPIRLYGGSSAEPLRCRDETTWRATSTTSKAGQAGVGQRRSPATSRLLKNPTLGIGFV